MTDEQREKLIKKHGTKVLAIAAGMLAIKTLIHTCENELMREAATSGLTAILMFASEAVCNGEPKPVIDACDEIERLAHGMGKAAKPIDDSLFKFDLE
jgi:hypothetical protein